MKLDDPNSFGAMNQSPGSSPHRACVRVVVWFLMLSLAFSTMAADSGPEKLVPVTMRIGFTKTVFLKSNRNDVEAAFKALAETIGRQRGFLVTVQTTYFSDASAFHAAIKAGEINFAVFDSLSYVAGWNQGDLTPVFIAANGGRTNQRYMVLVRQDSGLTSLDALRGKKIVELQAPNLSVGHTWLLSLLLAKQARAHEHFFSSVEQVIKPTAAVLPVFFGSRDACLVDEASFNLMQELNPQVGVRLIPLEISPPIAGAVLCASEANWSAGDFRPVLLKALRELQLDPAGQQILALFKIDRLVPFEESRLETARALWANFAKLRQEVRP